ncbi:MAG TPA: hypothetical protein VJV03_08575 [Pyrinomonadaceae bacterium]|nr:hypothetical protein [Pyrinomonadaceae bacterium]
MTLGKPEKDEESIGYVCQFKVSGPTSDRVKYAKGVDAFHAIQGALTLIAVDLEFLNQSFGSKLRWEGDRSGDLGFPVIGHSESAAPHSPGIR